MDFSKAMNPPEDGFDGQADLKVFAGERWVVCPWCGKRQIKILPETKMYCVPWICKKKRLQKAVYDKL